MEIKNKKELCNAIGEAIGITRLTVKDFVGEADSLEKAVELFERKMESLIKASTNDKEVIALRTIVYNYGIGKKYNTTYGIEYERLMGWIVKDYGEQPKDIKKLLNIRNLIMNVSSMDMMCVINGDKEFQVFKKDIEQRVGRKFA